ncbi:MAG: aspartate/glutamate racemase family protein [Pyrinomonadaceae bacterium]
MSQEREPRLGIVDWGIGGIGIYRRLCEQLGDIPVTYFSDTGVTPYGKMSRPELIHRLEQVIKHLHTLGVTHLVVGCNAASTVLPFLHFAGIKTKGVIDCTVAGTAKLKPKRLALIGGRRTVVSGVYRRAFQAHGIAIEQRIAQPLSALIESGDVSSPQLRDECRKILRPIRHASHLLLACTHYPAIAKVLKNYVSPETVLIDPAATLVSEIAKWKLPTGGNSKFLTSGDPAVMKNAAFAAWRVRITAPALSLPTRHQAR